MDTNSLDSNMVALVALIVTSMVMIAGSWITVVVLMIRQSNRLDTKFTGMIGDLDTKFTGMIGDLDTKFTGMIGDLDTKFTTRIDNQDNKMDNKIDALDTKIDNKTDALAAKIDNKTDALAAKIDALADDVTDVRERLARVEGHLMAPEGFRPRLRHSPSGDAPSSEDPGPSRREAG